MHQVLVEVKDNMEAQELSVKMTHSHTFLHHSILLNTALEIGTSAIKTCSKSELLFFYNNKIACETPEIELQTQMYLLTSSFQVSLKNHEYFTK